MHRLSTSVIAVVVALLAMLAELSAAPSRVIDLASPDAVLRWINAYRAKPDPAGVPAVVAALSRFGAFKDPEAAGVHLGFVAGVIAANPVKAEELCIKMLAAVSPGDQWVIVRAVAYSAHPDWKGLLGRLAAHVPSRQTMIDKYLAGKLPTMWQIGLDRTPSGWETFKSYVTLEPLFSDKPKDKPTEPTAELLDTFWGYYFATGATRPVLRIIAMLPWARDDDSVQKLTLGSMAAARDAVLLDVLKRAREHQPKDAVSTIKVLDEVIEAAETVDTARLRREALAAIEDLRRKGPGSRRNASLWGQAGQAVLAAGCIAAAAAGQIEFGLPCVIGGGLSSAALSFWDKQQ